MCITFKPSRSCLDSSFAIGTDIRLPRWRRKSPFSKYSIAIYNFSLFSNQPRNWTNNGARCYPAIRSRNPSPYRITNKPTFVKKLMIDNSLVKSNAGENIVLSITLTALTESFGPCSRCTTLNPPLPIARPRLHSSSWMKGE